MKSPTPFPGRGYFVSKGFTNLCPGHVEVSIMSPAKKSYYVIFQKEYLRLRLRFKCNLIQSNCM